MQTSTVSLLRTYNLVNINAPFTSTFVFTLKLFINLSHTWIVKQTISTTLQRQSLAAANKMSEALKQPIRFMNDSLCVCVCVCVSLLLEVQVLYVVAEGCDGDQVDIVRGTRAILPRCRTLHQPLLRKAPSHRVYLKYIEKQNMSWTVRVHGQYPKSISVSTLKACNAVNFPGGEALCL